MAQFVIRNLDDDVHQQLRKMAAARGESLEALIRDLLRRAAYEQKHKEKPLGTALVERFSKCGLTGGKTIAELKGEAVRVVEFIR